MKWRMADDGRRFRSAQAAAAGDVVAAQRRTDCRRARSAFTLVEVMVAAGILFMCLFAILALLSTSLRNARALQHIPVDASMLAAELSLTNKLFEGSASGDFEDLYPDYEWTREIQEVATNGLFQVDFTVYRRPQRTVESHMTVLLFRPESPAGSMGGGLR
jgi:Tfp pilus assembly protein PilV